MLAVQQQQLTTRERERERQSEKIFLSDGISSWCLPTLMGQTVHAHTH